MAWRVDEGNLGARRSSDLVSTDVLRDAAGLACGDVGRTNRIEQRGLAMVDMTHDSDDRGTRCELRRIVGNVE